MSDVQELEIFAANLGAPVKLTYEVPGQSERPRWLRGTIHAVEGGRVLVKGFKDGTIFAIPIEDIRDFRVKPKTTAYGSNSGGARV